MSFLSYAQNFEDVLLWRALSHVERGFYVDIGAQDPVVDSVSLAFYERGWHGVNVEPVPQYAQMLREQRPRDILVASAVSDVTGAVRLFEIPETGISTANRHIAESHRDQGHELHEIVVPCVTLATVFEFVDSPEIHWMKVDVEGHEHQVLSGWGTASPRPWIVVMESVLPLTRIESYAVWEPLLLAKDYRFAYFDGLNRYYVSGAHLELCDALKNPPNIFDDFELNGTANAPFHRGLVARAQIEVNRIEKRAEDSEIKHQAALRLLSEDAIRKEGDLTHQLLTLQERTAQDSAAAQLRYQDQVNMIQRESMACVEQLTARMEEQVSVALEQSTAYASELAEMRRDHSARWEAAIQEFSRERARQHAIFEDHLRDYRGRVSELQSLIAEITSSASWRITIPLRVFSKRTFSAADDAFDITPPGFDDSIRKQKEMQPAKSLRQLIRMPDREFVESAYVTILGRPPDAGGIEHYTTRLESGEARAALLRDLYRSEEARRAKVHIPWLGRAVFRYRVLCILVPGFRNLRFSRAESPMQQVMRRVEQLEENIRILLRGKMENQIGLSAREPERAETGTHSDQRAAVPFPHNDFSDQESIVARRIFRELTEATRSSRENS